MKARQTRRRRNRKGYQRRLAKKDQTNMQGTKKKKIKVGMLGYNGLNGSTTITPEELKPLPTKVPYLLFSLRSTALVPGPQLTWPSSIDEPIVLHSDPTSSRQLPLGPTRSLEPSVMEICACSIGRVHHSTTSKHGVAGSIISTGEKNLISQGCNAKVGII